MDATNIHSHPHYKEPGRMSIVARALPSGGPAV